mgnify:CR=1 FL=1
MSEITIEDFMKLDLRVARVEKAESVEEADKLLKLELSLGSLGEKTVFAGMKQAYEPDALIGKMVICVNDHFFNCGTNHSRPQSYRSL